MYINYLGLELFIEFEYETEEKGTNSPERLTITAIYAGSQDIGFIVSDEVVKKLEKQILEIKK